MKTLVDIFRIVASIWRSRFNSGGRIRGVVRFIKWQVAARWFPNGIVISYINDTKFLMKRHMTGATANFYMGLQEPSEMAFVLHFLRKGDLFSDVGANVGSYSLLAATTGANAVAVEPLPATFESLKCNVRLNNMEEQIHCHQCGLSNVDGRLWFSSDKDTMNRVLRPGERGAAVEVKVTTLDNLLDGRVPQVLKIDVEGHEMAVLRGAMETLSSSDLKAVIMETNGSGERYGVTDADLRNFMRDRGFIEATYEPFERTLNTKASGGLNTLFIRDVEAIRDVLRSAPRYQVRDTFI